MKAQNEMTSKAAPVAPKTCLADTIEPGDRVSLADPAYLQILEFLWEEAAVLDDDDVITWLAMLDENIRYRMPVCVTRRRGSKESYETEAMHLDESMYSLRIRVQRITETLAWAMDPANRTRRAVTSVRVWKTSEPAVFSVTSSFILTRTQDDEYKADIVTGKRFDLIRQLPDGSLRLLDRKILADQTTLGTHNLAIFL